MTSIKRPYDMYTIILNHIKLPTKHLLNDLNVCWDTLFNIGRLFLICLIVTINIKGYWCWCQCSVCSELESVTILRLLTRNPLSHFIKKNKVFAALDQIQRRNFPSGPIDGQTSLTNGNVFSPCSDLFHCWFFCQHICFNFFKIIQKFDRQLKLKKNRIPSL